MQEWAQRILLFIVIATFPATARAQVIDLGPLRCPGRLLRTIRASRWHQHEIETPSKTGNA